MRAAVQEVRVRTYVAEPERGRRKWTGKEDQQAAIYANRRRISGSRGKQLLRRRGELLERTLTHAYETGALRRLYVRGKENVQKKPLLQAATCNLALLLRKMIGQGRRERYKTRLQVCFLVLMRLIWAARIDSERTRRFWTAIPHRRRTFGRCVLRKAVGRK